MKKIFLIIPVVIIIILVMAIGSQSDEPNTKNETNFHCNFGKRSNDTIII